MRDKCAKNKSIIIDKRKDIFKSDSAYTLLYLFPFIERLTIEILEFFMLDVEFNEQGTFRTMNSLLEQKEICKVLGKSLVDKLSKYFSPDGLRNQIMHYDDEQNDMMIANEDILEIKNTAMELIKIYERELAKCDERGIEKIELIKIG